MIAAIATSVSAYAVSSSCLASGASSRDSPSSSIPVFSGIRWSLTISATGSVAQRQAKQLERLGGRRRDSTRYSEPYLRA